MYLQQAVHLSPTSVHHCLKLRSDRRHHCLRLLTSQQLAALVLHMRLLRKLFEGDHCFTRRKVNCEYFLGANTIHGQNLFEEMRYTFKRNEC